MKKLKSKTKPFMIGIMTFLKKINSLKGELGRMITETETRL